MGLHEIELLTFKFFRLYSPSQVHVVWFINLNSRFETSIFQPESVCKM